MPLLASVHSVRVPVKVPVPLVVAAPPPLMLSAPLIGTVVSAVKVIACVLVFPAWSFAVVVRVASAGLVAPFVHVYVAEVNVMAGGLPLPGVTVSSVWVQPLAAIAGKA